MANLCETCTNFRDGLSARPDKAIFQETHQFLFPEEADDGTKDFTLFHAVASNHYPCVVELLSMGENCDQTPKISKRTPLMTASQKGYSDIVKLLLDSGSDCNIKDTTMKSAVWYASSTGSDGCITLLLEAGAEFEYFDKYGSSPLQIAIEYGHLGCMDILLKQGAEIKYVDWQRAGLDICDLEVPVLKKMFSVIAEREGALMFHFFIKVIIKNDKSLLQWILDEPDLLVSQSGACTNVNYDEALHEAAEYGADETIEVLLDNKTWLGIDINGSGPYYNGKTALQNCCDLGDDNVAQLLLKYGADPDKIGNTKTEDARPPVFGTLQSLSSCPPGLYTLRALIQHGCNLEIKCSVNFNGVSEKVPVSPLEYALHGHNLFAAEMLILGGALRYNPTCSMMKPHTEVIHSDLECTKKDKEEFISRELQIPQPLYRLARISIRKTLGRNPERKICLLQLPRNVQEFLLLHDLNEIAETFETKMNNVGYPETSSDEDNV